MTGEMFISIIIGTIFVNNFILSRFLGLCPFIGVSKHSGPALSMGLAVTFVTTTASLITWVIYDLVLVRFHLEYLRTLSFILVIAFFVQFVDIVMQKKMPSLHKVLGIYLALITTNCAVFGVTVLNIDMFYPRGKSMAGGLGMAVLQGLGAGIGFTLAMVLMSGIRERLEYAEVPKCFRDIPITFIIASLMSLAFLGFCGFSV